MKIACDPETQTAIVTLLFFKASVFGANKIRVTPQQRQHQALTLRFLLPLLACSMFLTQQNTQRK